MTHTDSIICYVASGKSMDLCRPNPEQIEIEDIAWSLAHTYRFGGHLQWQISVARHSIHVAELVSHPCKLAALLHDAHEAYLGDMTRPVKRYLDLSGVHVDDLEGLWQHEIWKKYGCVPQSCSEEQTIIEADDLQLAREMASFAPEGPFRERGRYWLSRSGYEEISLLEPYPIDPVKDCKDFKKRFHEFLTIDISKK